MAIGVNHIFEEDDTAGGTSWTTAIETPTSGELTIVACFSPGTPTHTLSGTNGWNVTWTERVTHSANNGRITIFTGIPDSSTAGTLTITVSVSVTAFMIRASRWTGVDTTSPFVQTGIGDGTLALAQLDSPLAAFAVGSVSYLAVRYNTSAAVFTAEGSWALLGSRSEHSGPSGSSIDAWLNAEDTTPTITNDADKDWAIIGVEIAAEAVGGARPHNPLGHPLYGPFAGPIAA
ncbi:hypothetical protein LCGC14_2894760 [marine sediment metagenome]|uniref:Uncharacterized protein n=1 Tax=marine sediment metagenome TaxID=412755 RepID=A0A0F8XWJ2_9ZZZZ